MALLCYNKGCGNRFDEDRNSDGEAVLLTLLLCLQGWSCCKKRTTDFSEFLSIKGCTRGRHNNQKPAEPLRPEVSSSDKENLHTRSGQEVIYQGPKSAEALQRERPSPDEPKSKLPVKVSPSLAQLIEKMEISNKEAEAKRGENSAPSWSHLSSTPTVACFSPPFPPTESQAVVFGTRCKNAGCKTIFQGEETNVEICIHHPGVPVFHEGYKYWSCCCIKTEDFNTFLDQKGCANGKHRWIPKQDKKKVACRYDWHQTGSQVVITIYAKNSSPEHSYVEANQTMLTAHIQFENDKIFHKDFALWGVVDVRQSSASMVPAKVEVMLRKADGVAWGKLEDPNAKVEPPPEEEIVVEEPDQLPDWDIDDDDISESEDEEEPPPQKQQLVVSPLAHLSASRFCIFVPEE
ncbi:cysteine and histidine-rich domain-containing protein 1-like [Arapaima gigas]